MGGELTSDGKWVSFWEDEDLGDFKVHKNDNIHIPNRWSMCNTGPKKLCINKKLVKAASDIKALIHIPKGSYQIVSDSFVDH